MRSLRLARGAAAGLVAAVLLTSPGAGRASPLLYFVHADHLNTPRLIADQNQTTVWRWDQVEPFGANPADEDPDGNAVIFHMPFRFPGQYFDKETNNHYNMARDYDSAIGRYVQSDPIGLRGGLNTYAYVNANPLSFSDPTGEIVFMAALPFVGGGATGVGSFISTSALIGTLTWAVANADSSSQAPNALTSEQEQQKEREYDRYKRICNRPPPGHLNDCERAKWRYRQQMECRDLRKEWERRWGPTPGHAEHLEQIEAAIRNAAEAIKRHCKPCP